MSGISFDISYDDRSLRSALMGLAALCGNPAPVMRDLATYGAASTHERFEETIGPDGKPWKKSLRAQIVGGKTLTQAGHLGNSITSDSGPDWAAWGSNMIYARIHQLGGVIKPVSKPSLRFRLAGGGFRTVREVTMPARPFLGINEQDETEMVAIIKARLKSAAGG